MHLLGIVCRAEIFDELVTLVYQYHFGFHASSGIEIALESSMKRNSGRPWVNANRPLAGDLKERLYRLPAFAVHGEALVV